MVTEIARVRDRMVPKAFGTPEYPWVLTRGNEGRRNESPTRRETPL